MRIDKLSPLPRHFQLEEAIKRTIVEDGKVEGDPIPSERTLSRTFNVSRMTVRRAIASLEREGILRREGRRGTFVNSKSVINLWDRGPTGRLLAMVIPDIRDFFAARLINGMESYCNDLGFSIVLGSSDEEPEKALRQVERLVTQGVAGLIFVPVAGEDSEAANLAVCRTVRAAGLPMVLLDRYIDGLQVDTVVSDNFDGAYRATQHLISLGHRRIGFVGYPTCSTIRDRIDGYRKCLRDNGIHPDDRLVVQPHPRRMFAKTAEAVKGLLGLTPEATAVCTANDDLAMDVWTVLRQEGLQVPDDVALVGYDNALGANNSGALITTTEQPLYEQGRLACQMLLERANGFDGEPRFRVLKSTFVPGQSTLLGAVAQTMNRCGGIAGARREDETVIA